MSDKGQNMDSHSIKPTKNGADMSGFVFEKDIFSNVFEKDIRRVYLYKKAERLAKAIHLISPGFKSSPSLKDRLERVSVGLVDGAVLPPAASREALSHELLALSSLLGIARTGGMLSPMNADLVSREAQQLLAEIAGYEEPRLALDEMPSLASLAKSSVASEQREHGRLRSVARVTYDTALDTHDEASIKGQDKGHVSDMTPVQSQKGNSGRREAILSVLRTKGPSYIKDISTIVRDVSEKTIQRELAALVSEGMVKRTGDRRWTTYEIAG